MFLPSRGVKSSSRRALASIDLDQNGGYQQCYQSQAAARDHWKQKGIVMEQGQTARPTYGALYFLVRYGDWIAAVFALAPLAAGTLAWVNGLSIAFLAAGITRIAPVLPRDGVQDPGWQGNRCVILIKSYQIISFDLI